MKEHRKKLRAYISGALTGLNKPERMKIFYERVGEICEECGMNAYVPHRHTDPIQRPNIPPARIYRIDRERIEKSDLLIACLARESFGVGIEIEFANQFGIPVVLLAPLGKPLSRITAGGPMVAAVLRYRREKEAAEVLRRYLLRQFAPPSRAPGPGGFGMKKRLLTIPAMVYSVRRPPSAREKRGQNG